MCSWNVPIKRTPDSNGFSGQFYPTIGKNTNSMQILPENWEGENIPHLIFAVPHCPSTKDGDHGKTTSQNEHRCKNEDKNLVNRW